MSRSARLGVGVAAAGLGLCLALVGCSSGGGAPGGGAVGGSGTATDFSNSVAKIVCDAEAPCCSKSGKTYDPSGCQSAYAALFLGLFIGPAQKGGATYNASAGSACLSTLQQQLQSSPPSCDSSSSGSSKIDINTLCPDLFTGGSSRSVPPGGTCASSLDCAPSPGGKVDCLTVLTGGPNGSSEDKFCEVQVTGKAGDACGSGSPSPAMPMRVTCSKSDGLKCDFTSKTCVALGADGASCNFDDDCVAADACAGDPAATQRTCAPRLSAGSACVPSSSGGDPCDAASRCDAAGKTCVARMADGQPCMASKECASDACVNGACGSGSSGSGLGFACK